MWLFGGIVLVSLWEEPILIRDNPTHNKGRSCRCLLVDSTDRESKQLGGPDESSLSRSAKCRVGFLHGCTERPCSLVPKLSSIVAASCYRVSSVLELVWCAL